MVSLCSDLTSDASAMLSSPAASRASSWVTFCSSTATSVARRDDERSHF
jgi:hypothetical protein